MKTENLKMLQRSYLGRNEKMTQSLFYVFKIVLLILGVFFFITSFIRTGRLFSSLSMPVYCGLLALLPTVILSRQQKQIWKRFSAEEIDRIDKQSPTSKHLGPLLVTQDAVVYLSGGVVIALPIRDIVWIYPEEVTWRKGMLSNASASLRIVLRDKTTYTVLKNSASEHKITEDGLRFLQESLQEQRPNLLYGYSDELKELYASQFQSMVKTADVGK